MASGFNGGYSDYSISGNMNTRSITDPQRPYMSPLAGMDSDVSSQVFNRRPDSTAKRSLAEFQQHFQQQQQLALYLRNVKQRASYQQHASPISPLSPPVDFYGNSHSPDISSLSSSSAPYRIPIFQQLRQHQQRQQQQQQQQQNSLIINGQFSRVPISNFEPEKNMMNRLQELEKALLDDDDDDQNEEAVTAASVVTNSEWSDTIQRLIGSDHNTVSPASSSSSCSSSSITSAKQSLSEAATAISEGKFETATEILTRVNKVSNTQGTSEERLMAYMTSALKARINRTEITQDLYGKDHQVSIQMLFEVSPCFKLGFMAANLAILEAIPDDDNNVKLHVIDFDIGQAGQYVHLLHALAAKRTATRIALKITTFLDYATDLKAVGDGLQVLASKVGVNLCFRVMNLKINELNCESIGLEDDEILAVNFAFRLYKLPDESVSTENLRDELLRRVKNLSPKVVTLVEQEMNANTASFVARVIETCGYYGALFESLDATVPRNKPERVKIEEGLSRKMSNSVACEGRDRVERCEVFGKWRARMRMAGFEEKRLSQKLADSLRVKLNSGTRVNPGFTIKEETGGISFGWMGRTLTVASAWR